VSQATQLSLHHSAVRQQLERILAHGLFVRSDRMGRFLRLAVERALEGKAGELKEYLIGVEVFDRGASYDPRVDPIVRVEARRLRSKLKAYYDGDGRNDPVAIEFLSGTYAPRFRVRSKSPAPPGNALRAEKPAAESSLATIAVLPFVNLSPTPENEYFSDGLTEELIHALTKLPGMRVVAWNTAAQLRGRQEDLAAIRRQLQVGTALTGSVRIAGASLRVRAQLIDTGSGVYLWSETFDRRMQDIFAIQEEIARAIVRTLRVQLSGPEPSVAARSRTTISAYDWYLRGRYVWHRRTPEDLQKSVECFENAIAVDGRSALAHAGLADAYSLLVDYGLLHPSEGMPRAKAAAERSIALDPQLAEPHASLALIRGLYDWEWDDAERIYKRAIALNPGYATAHHWLAVDHYCVIGRFDEALAEIDIASQLDPLSGIIGEGRPYILMSMHRYEESIGGYRELIARDPSFYKGYSSMGRAYAQMGRHPEAIAMFERALALGGETPNLISAMAQTHALAGNQTRARELLGCLEEMSKSRYVAHTCFAIAHLGLGEHVLALDRLEKGLEQRDLPMCSINAHPLYDPLRAEPRFEALLRRMRFIGNSG
jgi:serine/threonine-protein kinase